MSFRWIEIGETGTYLISIENHVLIDRCCAVGTVHQRVAQNDPVIALRLHPLAQSVIIDRVVHHPYLTVVHTAVMHGMLRHLITRSEENGKFINKVFDFVITAGDERMLQPQPHRDHVGAIAARREIGKLGRRRRVIGEPETDFAFPRTRAIVTQPERLEIRSGTVISFEIVGGLALDQTHPFSDIVHH